MNFLEIQNDVLLDRFNESQRAAVKVRINSRYGRLWALEPWSFKRALVTHSPATDATQVTLATLGLQKVEGIWSDLPANFTKLYGDRPELALNWQDTVQGTMYGYTLIGDTIKFDRPVRASTDLQILGELKWTPLVADIDIPFIPVEYHPALSAGAAADMLLREADPTWQGEEKSFNDQVNEMRLSYMSNQRMAQAAYPSWP